MAQPPSGARAERTRAAVLEAAELLFAERGFDATRLEDIAERVGIRRASIVYYFKDKRELYDAVLDSVFGGLYDALSAALSQDLPLTGRIEAGISSWVEYVGRRATIARLILREVANAGGEQDPTLVGRIAPFVELVTREILTSPDFSGAKLARIDPVHVASTVAGTTVFFVAAMPTLLPDLEIDPVSAEHLKAHEEELLRIVRHLLTPTT